MIFRTKAKQINRCLYLCCFSNRDEWIKYHAAYGRLSLKQGIETKYEYLNNNQTRTIWRAGCEEGGGSAGREASVNTSLQAANGHGPTICFQNDFCFVVWVSLFYGASSGLDPSQCSINFVSFYRSKIDNHFSISSVWKC